VDTEAVTLLKSLYQVTPKPDYLPNDFILVPLQLEADTSILHDSAYIKTMYSLVGFVSKHFFDFPVVVCKHPKDSSEYNFKNVIYTTNISTLSLIPHARAVIGINSTLLIESLIYSKPVLALGKNVASGKGVFYEGEGAFLNPRKLLEIQPSQEAIDQVLTLLLSKQFKAATPTANILSEFFYSVV
jgi:capsule polysaccharide modification protein KpsS